MAFRNWRIGMHIQQDHIAIVALLHERSRWALRRWWRIPLMPGIVRHGMVVDADALVSKLQSWRRELPLQHQICIAFPAARTLQKRLPRPQISLRESEQATWIASAMAQQLEMPASSLCVDYLATGAADGWRVTAAQRLDVNVLRHLASRLKLRVVGIVPDASALSAFLPWLPAEIQGLAWRDEDSWLWATADSWGSCLCSEIPLFLAWFHKLTPERFVSALLNRQTGRALMPGASFITCSLRSRPVAIVLPWPWVWR